MSSFRKSLRVVGQEEGSPYPKASLFLRGCARAIDLAIAWVLYVSTGPAGVVVSLLYLLFADGMLQGQSPGKKLGGIERSRPAGAGAVAFPGEEHKRHRRPLRRFAHRERNPIERPAMGRPLVKRVLEG